MPDVFTKAKRSEVMSRIRGRGNHDTELALAKLLRANGIKGWRRHVDVRSEKVEVRGKTTRTSNFKPRPFAVRPDFVFPQTTDGDVRGRLFLARLPEARDVAGEPRGVVAAKNPGQQASRRAGFPRTAGLARVANLGT